MCLGHVYIVIEPVGSARLTFVDGYDEELRNGPEVKIDILKAYVWITEVYRVKSGFYRSTGRLPEPPGNLMGLSGLRWK